MWYIGSAVKFCFRRRNEHWCQVGSYKSVHWWQVAESGEMLVCTVLCTSIQWRWVEMCVVLLWWQVESCACSTVLIYWGDMILLASPQKIMGLPSHFFPSHKILLAAPHWAHFPSPTTHQRDSTSLGYIKIATKLSVFGRTAQLFLHFPAH